MKNFIEVGKTEEEQIENIKSWLSENLLYIVLGLSMGFGGLFSWNYYNNYQDTQAQNARSLYLTVSQNRDEKVNQDTLEILNNDYPDSIYLAQSKLLLAKYASQDKKYDQAIEYLMPLSSNSNKVIATIAQLRLSEIYIEQKNFKPAIALLTKKTQFLENLDDDSYFQAIKQNLLGDIYILQGQNALAKEQYTQASKQTGISASGLGKMLNIKLNNLK